jgi:cytoskeleton protein RodZ
MMSSFGENLRREREMRGVTLEEIAAATKISVRFLECVENQEFSKLPGGIFTRSFIRSYGRYLGLDEEALLAEYQHAAGAAEEQDVSRLPGLRPRSADPKRSRTAQFVVPLVAVLLLAAGYAVWRHSRPGPLPSPGPVTAAEPPKPVASPATATAPAAAPSAANLANASSSNPGATAIPASSSGVAASANSSAGPAAAGSTPTAPSSASNAVPDQSGLTLQIAATERSWVTVSADGQTVFQSMLHPNDVKTFHATKDLDVLTGNAQGIILTLNGQTLKPLGQEGEVKSVHLTRKSLSQPAP